MAPTHLLVRGAVECHELALLQTRRVILLGAVVREHKRALPQNVLRQQRVLVPLVPQCRFVCYADSAGENVEQARRGRRYLLPLSQLQRLHKKPAGLQERCRELLEKSRPLQFGKNRRRIQLVPLLDRARECLQTPKQARVLLLLLQLLPLCLERGLGVCGRRPGLHWHIVRAHKQRLVRQVAGPGHPESVVGIEDIPHPECHNPNLNLGLNKADNPLRYGVHTL
mmetsp:Transcript_4424/g.10422  ORF Transcript_4424/g.10422 Transcript_4424/m.10422 type:complete len:225 (+) Transcript_4424:1545-2219(+)